MISLTYRAAGSCLKLFSALAAADIISLRRIGAVFFGVNSRVSIASCTLLFLTKLAIRLAFLGEILICLSIAFISYDYFLASLPPCPRNIFVGENSPSLCPTMFSLTKTGMCCFPLWTAKVCPTNSGEMSLLRDHVLIGLFLPSASSAMIFLSSFGSMYGPFFELLDMAI